MRRYGLSRSIQLTCADWGSVLRMNASIWCFRFCSSATWKFWSCQYADSGIYESLLASLITAINIWSTMTAGHERGPGSPRHRY